LLPVLLLPTADLVIMPCKLHHGVTDFAIFAATLSCPQCAAATAATAAVAAQIQSSCHATKTMA
jgi:hypothetical protein